MNIIKSIFPQFELLSDTAILISLAIMLVFYLLVAIAGWKIFKKMDEPGWKVFVPIYNMYIIFKRCSKKKYFWQSALCFLIDVIIDSIWMSNGYTPDLWVRILLTIVQLLCCIRFVVLQIKMWHGLSKSFGHGIFFTAGLIFFPYIFELILGFGSSKYKPIKQKKK